MHPEVVDIPCPEKCKSITITVTLKDVNKFLLNLAHSFGDECLTIWHKNSPRHLMCVPGATKESRPIKNSANFSRTLKMYNTKSYTRVTHEIICKLEKFCYIIYRIDKITLLLDMAT